MSSGQTVALLWIIIALALFFMGGLRVEKAAKAHMDLLVAVSQQNRVDAEERKFYRDVIKWSTGDKTIEVDFNRDPSVHQLKNFRCPHCH